MSVRAVCRLITSRQDLTGGSSSGRLCRSSPDDAGWPLRHPHPDGLAGDGVIIQLASATARSSSTNASDRMLVEGVEMTFGQHLQVEGRFVVQQPPTGDVSEGAVEQALVSDPVRRLSVRARKADAISQDLKRVEIMDSPKLRDYPSFYSTILHQFGQQKSRDSLGDESGPFAPMVPPAISASFDRAENNQLSCGIGLSLSNVLADDLMVSSRIGSADSEALYNCQIASPRGCVYGCSIQVSCTDNSYRAGSFGLRHHEVGRAARGEGQGDHKPARRS